MKTMRWLIGVPVVFLCAFLTLELSHGAEMDSTETHCWRKKNIGNGSVRTWLKVDTKNAGSLAVLGLR